MEYKKYGQYVNGQFKKGSKKAQALFIGRSVQALTESLKDFEEKCKLRMDTLRFIIQELPLTDDSGVQEPDWIRIIVAYEVGSETELTEEDRKELEERRKAREEAKRKEEEQYGLAAMEAMDRELIAQGIIPVQSEIQ